MPDRRDAESAWKQAIKGKPSFLVVTCTSQQEVEWIDPLWRYHPGKNLVSLISIHLWPNQSQHVYRPMRLIVGLEKERIRRLEMLARLFMSDDREEKRI